MGKQKLGACLLIAAVCLTHGGCVKAKVLSFTRYNKTTDSFSLLEVYANIATKDEHELKHIATLWHSKENLIINPISVRLQFYTPTIIERLGKHSYRGLALGAVTEREPETLTTAVDLDTIQVIPGEFFLNKDKDLCYYHQVVVPGAAVDAAMREMVPVIADELAKFADQQIKKPGTEGSKKMSWNDIRELTSELFEKTRRQRQPPRLSRGPWRWRRSVSS